MKSRAFRRRIQKIKKGLVALGDLHACSLSEKYIVGGKRGCCCKADPPHNHGPYYQLGWTRKRKSTARFVRRDNLPDVRKHMKNYERVQSFVDQWIDLSIQSCQTR